MSDLDAVLARVFDRIAPVWPLDRFVAVNPLWGWIDGTPTEAAARLAALSGARLAMPRDWYLAERDAGRLDDASLAAALDEEGVDDTPARLVARLRSDENIPARRQQVMDLADATRDLVRSPSWRDFVTNSLSQCCAAYFDEGQAQLGPSREGGLWGTWRRYACADRSPSLLLGLGEARSLAAALPEDPHELLQRALTDLDVPTAEREAYLTSLLLDVNGWASWCAQLRWRARSAGGDDMPMRDLLAMRLAWEWMLFRAGGPSLAGRWQLAMAAWPAADAAAREAGVDVWRAHRAVEIGFQRPLAAELARSLAAPPAHAASVQAAFCMDVRSERLRRALEAQSPQVQTLGTAGFFGLPVEYAQAGGGAAVPHLPALLEPVWRVTDAGLGASTAERRSKRLGIAEAWRGFRVGALSGFAFVETLGVGALGGLVAETLGIARASSPDDAELGATARRSRAPSITSAAGGGAAPDDATRADLAASVLRGMALTRGFARTVLLVGHGSTSRNNPHAASLDCGACGGHGGEVNARVAAALLEDPAVRAGLAVRGIEVPVDTRFIAALHDTTTDDVTLFTDDVPPSHAGDVEALRRWLAGASTRCRGERAGALGLGSMDRAHLDDALRARAHDWSQPRPEWGLANNAALVIAPRERTRHLDLAGRCFLHEYRAADDAEGSTLGQLLAGPLVVAHWINLQYLASTTDPLRYGSGNKLLHNVVGGHLGVFEGNGGDLRIGLPWQSVHDGARFMHAPLRLSVFVEASRDALDAALAANATVRRLVEHRWLDLLQLDAATRTVHARRADGWHRVAAA